MRLTAGAGAQSATIDHQAAVGAYDGTPPEILQAVVFGPQDDVLFLNARETPQRDLIIPEGEQAAYYVSPAHKPETNITVEITVEGSPHVRTDQRTLVFTPENWDQPQEVTATTVHDPDAYTERAVIRHRLVIAGERDRKNAGTLRITVEDDETPSVTISKTAITVPAGGAGEYTVVLKTAVRANVTVTAGGHAGTGLTLDNRAVTFTPANWNVEQTVTVRAGRDAPDGITRITHSVSGGGYGGASAETVTVTTTPGEDTGKKEVHGVRISRMHLEVPEGGAAAYTIVMTERPSGPVNVNVNLPTAPTNDLSVDKRQVTFNGEDWDNPRTITVSAAEDTDAATDPHVNITHTVTRGNEKLEAAALTVAILENDPGIRVSPPELHLSEGAEGEYTVDLITNPEETVDITLSHPPGTGVATSAQTLKFTAGDWKTSQTVTVTTEEDRQDGINRSATITHTAHDALGDYRGVRANVNVHIYEDDAGGSPSPQGVMVTPAEVAAQEGGRTTYTVGLDFVPGAPMIVTVNLPPDSKLAAAPRAVRFNQDDGYKPKTITIYADRDRSGQKPSEWDPARVESVQTITHDVSGWGYRAEDMAPVQMTTLDGRPRGIVTSPASTVVLEGETQTYTVRLHAEPESNVTVDITGHENTAISVSPETLTFTPGDWNVPKTVEVTAAQDDDETDEDAVTLTHSSPEEEYKNVPEMTVSIRVQDDDRPTVLTSRTAITLLEGEGGGNAYGVRLSVQPEVHRHRRSLRPLDLGERGCRGQPAGAGVHPGQLGHPSGGHRHRTRVRDQPRTQKGRHSPHRRGKGGPNDHRAEGVRRRPDHGAGHNSPNPPGADHPARGRRRHRAGAQGPRGSGRGLPGRTERKTHRGNGGDVRRGAGRTQGRHQPGGRPAVQPGQLERAADGHRDRRPEPGRSAQRAGEGHAHGHRGKLRHRNRARRDGNRP